MKTTQPNVTIRGRRWVMVPTRGASAAARSKPEHRRRPRRPLPRRPRPSARRRRPPRRVVPADVQALADALRSRRLRQRAGDAGEVDEPREHDPAFRHVRQPVAERSEAHGGVRARAGVRRAAQRRRLARATRADGCSASTTRACASRRAPIAFECWWFVTEAGGARRALPARERDPLHPARAAALPDVGPPAPRLCVRLGAAVAARRADAGAGAGSRRAATKRR